MTLKVVILELTDQRNRIKFCDQYGSQQKEIVHNDDDEIYFSGDGFYLQKEMDVASIFEELIPGYISDHVLC